MKGECHTGALKNRIVTSPAIAEVIGLMLAIPLTQQREQVRL